MPSPTQNEVHIDVGLSDASIFFRNEEFIGEDYLRAKMVDKISDRIWVYGREAFQLVEDVRAPGTRGAETGWTLSTIPYVSQEHSQSTSIPDQARTNADAPLSLEVDATEIKTAQVQLRLEYDTASMLTTSGNYATGLSEDLSAAGNTPWSDPNSDPIGDIEAAKALVLEACGKEPNVAAAGHKVKLALKNHPKIIARFSYNGRPGDAPVKVTDQMLADLFDLDEFMDAKGQYDTAPEGTTGVFNFIWGNNLVLSVRPASIGLKTLAHASIIRVKGYRLTESWYQQPESATWIRVRDHYVPFLISNLAGFLFQNCVKAGA